MIQEYHEIGTEGHNILMYKDLFVHAKENKEQVKLHAGFIPRTFAKLIMQQGEEGAIKAALEKDYLHPETNSLEGSEYHYNFFESMISGRNMHDESLKPNDNFRKIFKA